MSPCTFTDPYVLFGLTPPVIGVLIGGGQKFFDAGLFPSPIEDFDLGITEISEPSIDNDTANDARVTPPYELRFATIEGRRVADARDLMSPKEWTDAHSDHVGDLATDALQEDANTRYAQRQLKLDNRDLTFSRNGEPIGLRKAGENAARSLVICTGSDESELVHSVATFRACLAEVSDRVNASRAIRVIVPCRPQPNFILMSHSGPLDE